MRYGLPAVLAVLVTTGALHAAEVTYKAQRLAPSDRGASQFGAAVAVGENVIAVGAYLSDANGRDSGAVYLYRKVGTEWTPFEGMPLHQGPGEWFGFDVAIQGNKLVVGAPHPEGGPGAAYVYDLDTRAVRKLTVPGARNGDEVGSAVAIDGDSIAVGARGVEERKGAVYVFSSDGGMQTLTAPTRVEKAEFGQSLALRGKQLVVGAPSPYSASHSPGAAYLFNLPGSSPTALVPSPLPEEGSAFGYAVAIGDRGIIVGAPLAGRNSQGQVFLFKLTGAFEGILHARSEGDQAGVAVAADQTRIVLGAVGADTGCGSAYLYQGDDFKGPLVPTIRTKGAGFGFGTAIHGETVVVGAFKEKGTGAAYVFEPTVTIPTVKVTLAAVTSTDVAESAGTVSVKATVSVTGGDMPENLSVTISTGAPSGTSIAAIAGRDYKATTKSFALPLKPQGGTVDIPILDDGIPEADETFNVTLTASSGVTVEGSPLPITIKDDDCAKPVLPSFLTLREGGPSEKFDVSLPRQPAQDVDFSLSFAYDAPSGKPDVSVAVEPSTWTVPAAREKKQRVELKALNDAACNEPSRDFTLTVTTTSADPLFTCTQTIPGRVESDDDPCVEVSADVCIDESDTVRYTYVIRNTGPAVLVNRPGLELTDTLPGEVSVVSATADRGVATVDYVSNQVAWSGSIPVGLAVTIEVLAALAPGVAPGTVVKDEGIKYRYDADGNGTFEIDLEREASFIVGNPDDACP